MISRRILLLGCPALLVPFQAVAQTPPKSWQDRLVEAARTQVGVTTIYDPAYVRLAFPNGDVPRERGVCTDVVVRAFRDAFGLDLQKIVNTDMKAAFSQYPKRWGLKRTDANIDHRRVPNLEVLFTRKGARLPVSPEPAAFLPGDIVAQILPGNLPHIGIVSDRKSDAGRPLMIHNIGSGAREEDVLFAYPHSGHFRLSPDKLA